MDSSKNLECLFCTWEDPTRHRIIAQSGQAYARRDDYPETEGHSLVIPKSHVNNFFELSFEQVAEMLKLSQQVKSILDEMYNPNGYNIFTNVGRAAGQVIMHAHLHIVPQYGEGKPIILAAGRHRGE